MASYVVDTDGATGDFSSLNAFAVAIGNTIEADFAVSGGHTLTCQASTLQEDTATAAIKGFTNASSTATLTVVCNDNYVFNPPKGNYAPRLSLEVPYMRWTGGTFKYLDYGTYEYAEAIELKNATDITIEKIIGIIGRGTGAGSRILTMASTATNAKALSCLIYGTTTNTGGAVAIYDNSQFVVNCTCIRAAISHGYQTGTIINTLSTGTANDVTDTFSSASTNNIVGVMATGVGGTNITTGVSMSDTLCLVPDIHEYAPANGSILIGGGVDASAHTTTDIGGAPFNTAAWNVGCFATPEFISVNTDANAGADYTSLNAADVGMDKDYAGGHKVIECGLTSASYWDSTPVNFSTDHINQNWNRKLFVLGKHQYKMLHTPADGNVDRFRSDISIVVSELDIHNLEIDRDDSHTVRLTGANVHQKFHACTLTGDYANVGDRGSQPFFRIDRVSQSGSTAQITSCISKSGAVGGSLRYIRTVSTSGYINKLVNMNSVFTRGRSTLGSGVAPYTDDANIIFEVKNNVFTDLTSSANYVKYAGSVVTNNFHNLATANGFTTGASFDETTFVKPQIYDLHPAQGSPLVGAGVDVSEYVLSDAGGTKFDPAAWDVGALKVPTFYTVRDDGTGDYTWIRTLFDAIQPTDRVELGHVVVDMKGTYNQTGDASYSNTLTNSSKYSSMTVLADGTQLTGYYPNLWGDGVKLFGLNFHRSNDSNYGKGINMVGKWCETHAVYMMGLTGTYTTSAFFNVGGFGQALVNCVGYNQLDSTVVSLGSFENEAVINTIYFPVDGGTASGFSRGYGDRQIYINIICPNAYYAGDTQWGSIVKSVVSESSSGTIPNTVIDFVDKPNGDLRPTDSTNNINALSAGFQAWAWTTIDLEGVVRTL